MFFYITSSAEPIHLYASRIFKTSLLEQWECSVPDAIACTKPRADTDPGMWFNTAYFSRPSVDAHGQQNSNQLGTVGLNIPVFWGCFLTPAASRGVLSSQPCRARDTNTSRGPSLQEHLFKAIFNPVKTRPFISSLCVWGWNALWSNC